ncbi:MAG: DUF1232 domain-containing protein [Alphaproteobacteria bacterium]|nr:DUF1232 domain-containing protein [Alphaproteobacteria bacterium]
MREDDREAFDEEKLRQDERRVREGFWPKFRATLGRIPFSEDLLAAWYCANDRATPLFARATLFGALAYFVLPADVIPDIIVGLGYTDDLAVLLAAMKAIGAHIRPEHRERARRTLGGEIGPPGA